jgi:hypothetical protein
MLGIKELFGKIRHLKLSFAIVVLEIVANE